MSDHENHLASLRRWARGMHGCEAAVELLIRGHGGKFAGLDQPWMRTGARQTWVDFEVVGEHTGCLSGGEQLFLLITVSIAGVTVPVDLSDIAYLDVEEARLILVALAHAFGTGSFRDEAVVT